MTTYDQQLAELHSKRGRLIGEMEAIADVGEAGHDGTVERMERLSRGVDKLDAAIASTKAAAREEIRSLVANGGPGVKFESGADGGQDRAPVRDDARRTIDSLARDATPALERALERVTSTLDGHDVGNADVSLLSRWIATTGHPDYLRAFTRVLRDPENGHREFDAAELDAFRNVKSLSRAMALDPTSAGGFMVPFQLDPSVIDTGDGSHNEVRRAARKVIATSDKWHGVSSDGVVASWSAEAEEASDDAPTLAQPEITNHKIQAWVPISIEALQDATNVAQEVAAMLSEARDELEAEAFVTGTGDASNQPFGILTRLAGVTNSKVDVTTSDTFSLADLYKLDEALPARYRKRGSWLAHRAIYNDIRQFDTSGGAALWSHLEADVPARLIGLPAYEAEDMPSTPSGTNNLFLVQGSFEHYIVSDRVGTTLEFVPHVFGPNQRPTGQRGWYMHARVGGDVVNAGAFRVLDGG